MKIMHIYRFARVMRRSRSNLCGDVAAKTQISKIRMNMIIYADLDYSRSKTGICKAIYNIQVCETTVKTGRTALYVYTSFLGMVMSNGLLVFSCSSTPSVCMVGGKKGMSPMIRVEIGPEAASVKSVTWWTERLGWDDEEQWGYNKWF